MGAVAVTANARASDDELTHYADQCGAMAEITQPKFAERIAAQATGAKWMVVTESGHRPTHRPLQGADHDPSTTHRFAAAFARVMTLAMLLGNKALGANAAPDAVLARSQDSQAG